ncbi:methyltransferase-like protein 17, mitochondrial isoform X2 [Cylas formicarius]|nr:methyltransferase-like protein 17, mitochondrial isoform X2 [Cylas formicarius]
MEDYPVKSLVEASLDLQKHLKLKIPPMEEQDIKEATRLAHQKVLFKHKQVPIKDENDEHRFRQMVNNKVSNILRCKINNWKAVKYDAFLSLVYLIGRSAAEYSVLTKIFGDIADRDPEFNPRSLFDFGSGVGTVTWAASRYWKKYIFEYFHVDISRDMNDLAELLLKGGRKTAPISLKGVFFRQFLPASSASYDLVVSAYSLLELPSTSARLETVLNLWNKTHQYLVIIEQGTTAGFKVVNEARDFILHIKKEGNKGHIFSPCPHDNVCPKYVLSDGTPCNFEVNYVSMPVGASSSTRKELYSYVVLKKGERNANDVEWPRIVKPVLVKPRHTICRMCVPDGKLQEVIFTKARHGKTTYHCARSSKWGDLLPITLSCNDEEKDTESIDVSKE